MDDLNFLNTAFSKYTDSNNPLIILVEDDVILANGIKAYLKKTLKVEIKYFKRPSDLIDSASQVVEEFPEKQIVLITDISFDDSSVDGLVLLDLLKEEGITPVNIVMTGFASIETAIAATKKGVFHYLTKPFELSVLKELVLDGFKEKYNISKEHLENIGQQESIVSRPIMREFKLESPKEEDFFCGMIGRSKKMRNIFERIKKVSDSKSTVLITGPSGTGKELVANAIHALSNRNSNKFVSVNCGAIPSELLESELFGHLKGSFTGAISDRKGRFELANQGTIFLDEIGDMPLLLQVKILRVLQSRQIEKVGGGDTVNVDVRIITATHRNLEERSKSGDFREDLYYRLNVIPIKIPALSERREDIPLLISHFLSRFVSADGRNNIEFDDETLELLISYDWPGNVRELENLIERLVILRGGGIVKATDLPAKFLQHAPHKTLCEGLIDLPETGIDLKGTLNEIEVSLIMQALERTKGNKNQASKLLSMNRTCLLYTSPSPRDV